MALISFKIAVDYSMSSSIIKINTLIVLAVDKSDSVDQ